MRVGLVERELLGLLELHEWYQLMALIDYPTEPPSIRALSTNGGATRMSPNINANGHICL